MGQLDDGQVKGQNLSRMNLIVKRIEVELAQLKNLINEQIQGLTSSSSNCDGNPDPDGNTGVSSIIDDNDDSYCLVDTLKIEDDLTAEDHDDNDINNYQDEFNEDQDHPNSQNRSSIEDELILGGVNFNFEVPSKETNVNPQSFSFTVPAGGQYEQDKVIISQVHSVGSVDLKSDLDSIQILNRNLLEGNFEVEKNDKKLIQDSIVQMGVRCEQNPLILHSNPAIDQVSQSKNERYQNNHVKTVEISSKSKKSLKKSHICSTCSKSFASFSNLLRHMRVHTGEKPYVCNLCNRAFARQDKLKVHLVRHLNIEPQQTSRNSFNNGSMTITASPTLIQSLISQNHQNSNGTGKSLPVTILVPGSNLNSTTASNSSCNTVTSAMIIKSEPSNNSNNAGVYNLNRNGLTISKSNGNGPPGNGTISNGFTNIINSVNTKKYPNNNITISTSK